MDTYISLSMLLYMVCYIPCDITAIQCFSCKGSGTNEVAANINCLERGYLENCDDFYEYYTKIEDKKVLTDEYYYDEDEDEYYYDDEEDINSDEYYDESSRKRRDIGVLKTMKQSASYSNYSNGMKEMQIVYEEYENYVDRTNKHVRLDDESKAVTDDKEQDEAKTKKTSKSEKQMSLPKDPEHHCYSRTIKTDWEEYSVEKGCKKIAYCRSDRESKPAEWTLPWNFCCDKSRCNAKQVKDKPQRIYGMNCRRTDDCIQGHVTRAVCPHLYKSCPKIPPTLIKMECITKGADPSDFKQRYRNPFQEKKCLCTAGNFPRGPVCTSDSLALTATWTFIVSSLISCLLLNLFT